MVSSKRGPRGRTRNGILAARSVSARGEGWIFVEKETAPTGPGDVVMLSPGVPHWGRIDRYPLQFVTVYFLPWVPIEIGPGSDGVRLLRRFTAHQSLEERVLRPPLALRKNLTARMQELVVEFERNELGREIRLRTLLMELLLTILRWEHAQGRDIGGEELGSDWHPLMKGAAIPAGALQRSHLRARGCPRRGGQRVLSQTAVPKRVGDVLGEIPAGLPDPPRRPRS